MKIIIAFTLLFTFPGISLSQTKTNALYFIYDPSECQNCITEELNLSLKYYKLFPDQVFFVVENSGYKQKLAFLVSKLDFKINPDNILVDESLYKKYVKHPIQLSRNNKFSTYKLGSSLSDFFNFHLTVEKVAQTIPVPKRLDGFRCSLMQTSENEIALVYDELGEIRSNSDTINLLNKLDTVEMLLAMHLSETDIRLTFDELKNKNSIGQALFQIMAPVTTDETDNKYFTTMVTYSHQLTNEEIITVRKLNKKYDKMLKNAENEGITMYKHQLFISQFDDNYNYVKSYPIAEPADGYNNDYVSPFYKTQDNFVGNLSWYEADTIEKRPLPTYGHYKLQGDSIQFQHADPFSRPLFYAKEGFDNNCANTTFNKVGESTIYQYVVYPCAIDVDKHVRYEIPMKDIKAICKLEKQAFNSRLWLKYYTLGLVEVQDGIHCLLFRARNNQQVYYGIFNDEGEYFGFGKLEQKVPMAATMTLNGNLINLLDNEIQFLNIQVKD